MPDLSAESTPSEAGGLKLATWNINGMRARLEFLEHWLQSRRPDVVGLQELKLEMEKLPRARFRELGYHFEAHSQKSWNGVAVLSRHPIEVLERGLPGEEEAGARLITVRTAGLVFTTVYCPNGKSTEHDDFPGKLRWFERLIGHVDATREASEPYVLCGDFNVCPGPADSWNDVGFRGRIFHTDAERQRFADLVGWGLEDLYRSRGPNDGSFSWWDYRGGAFHRNRGLRIDLLLATLPVAERVRAVCIDREYRKKKEGLIASDHAPVLAEVDGDPDSMR
jgi:exodeoxyribonuclease-3